MILAIDPGLDTGWALFYESGVLLDCNLGQPPSRSPSSVVIERPQVYPNTGVKQANDLITLAIQAGRYAEEYRQRGCHIHMALPHAWKGTVPKIIHNKRVLAKLSGNEATKLPKLPQYVLHNVVDAVGLGKWFTSLSGAAQLAFRV